MTGPKPPFGAISGSASSTAPAGATGAAPGPVSALGTGRRTTPPDLAELASQPITADLGPELATQLLLSLGGVMNEPAFRSALMGFLDAREAASIDATPSGKKLVDADAILNYLAGSLLLGRPRPAGPLGLFEYTMDRMYEWQAAHPGVHLHKAGAYYWAGLRDVELDNVERGLLYMHQAVREDEASKEMPMPPTPATWFVTMDPTDPNQAFHARVVEYAAIVEGYLNDYAARGLGSLSVVGLRTRLRAPNMLNAAVALLHVVAQVAVMTDASTLRVREHGFAALTYSRVALEICLVFEDLATPFVPAHIKTLGDLLPRYGVSGTINITPAIRDRAAAAFKGNLDTTLIGLLDTGSLAGVGVLTPQERDVLLLYGVRNASAHRLGRSSLLAVRFEELARHLLFAVFHLIEKKYP